MIYFFISLSALFAAIGHIFLKLGAGQHNTFSAFINWHILLGCIFYGTSMILWIYSLSKIPLSAAFAFTMLTFILVYFFSWLWLGESISWQALLGIALIGIGMANIIMGQT